MSMHQNLEDAICLLALISNRPPGLEESTQQAEPSDIGRELESYPNDEEFDDPEDPTVLGADPEHEQYCIELMNQFLDRLAENLARFKTDAQAKTSNDAKHVSAAMMVCYEDEERVKIFCAKNEGLEQEDDDFLARWELLMESIARKGSIQIPLGLPAYAYDTVLSGPEHVVWLLYKTLLRDFTDIPNIGDPEWVRFGFCYCTSRAQMELLAKAYIQLATHASLNQIATAWESDTVLDAMVARGIAISALASNGIYPHQPSPETIGIYRFMSEVSHGLRGCLICPCKNVRCKFHSKDEPLLCQKSEVDYGFHSVNTWERWKLLNFYSDLFANPKFNSQKMQEATRHPNAHTLEKYIDIIWNEHMTDGMFPKLTSRLKFKGVHPPCECVIHKIPISEGVEYNVKIEIDWLRKEYEERNREPVSEL